MKNMKKGFTIIEVLAVMIIIAMASLVSIPKIDDVMEQPKNLKVMTDLKSYEFAILELHYAKKQIDANSISSIVDSELEFTHGESKGDNPYGNKYKLVQNGIDDVTIESLKSGSRIIDVVQSLHAYKSGTKMIIDYENIDESLSSEIIVDRTASIEPPENIDQYYTFAVDDSTGGMKVGLVGNFRTAIESGQQYLDWKPGQPLPNPGTSHGPNEVTSYEGMFRNMQVSEIDVSDFQTEGIRSTIRMFEGCKSKIIGIERWRLNNLTSTSYMFRGYKNTVAEIRLNGKFTGTEGVNDVYGMFETADIKIVDLTKFNIDNVDNINHMFETVNIGTIRFGNVNNSKILNLDCFLNSVKVDNFETGLIKLPNARTFISPFRINSNEVDLSKIELNTSISWSISYPFVAGDNSTYFLKDMATINKFRAIPNLCENSTLTLKPTNVDNYYKYTLVGGGYAVSLTDGFKAALTGGKSYEKWTYGTPLPNPGKTYNNKPVISYNGTFMGLKVTELDLSLWDMNNVKDTTAMFKGAEITNLKILYWKSTKAPMLSISQMFQNAKIANVPSIGNMMIDGDTNKADIFTGSTMTQMKVHSAMLSMWEKYETATTKVIQA